MTKATSPWPFPFPTTAADETIKQRDAAAGVLAAILLLAMGLREGSYDHAAADVAQQEADAKRQEAAATGRNNFMWFGPDYAEFYRKALHTCCYVAARELHADELAQPAYLLLHSNSNDAVDWAIEVANQQYATVLYDESRFKNIPSQWDTHVQPVGEESDDPPHAPARDDEDNLTA